MMTASLVGLGVSTSLYFKTQAAREAETEQRAIAEQVSGFLTDMLASVNQRKAAGKDVGMLRELLDEASHRVSEQFADAPGSVGRRFDQEERIPADRGKNLSEIRFGDDQFTLKSRPLQQRHESQAHRLPALVIDYEILAEPAMELP